MTENRTLTEEESKALSEGIQKDLISLITNSFVLFKDLRNSKVTTIEDVDAVIGDFAKLQYIIDEIRVELRKADRFLNA